MRPNDIYNRSDNRSKFKAKHQALQARLYKVEDNKIIYTVNSSKGNKQYIVTIQLLSLTGNKLRSLKSALQGDIRINCTCDAFLYQGYKYISWKANTGIDKETRSPDITNPSKTGMACKHILVVLEQLKSDYDSIYSLFKKTYPRVKVDNKNNKFSSTLTEIDLSIIENFKDMCYSLYDSYTEYLESGDDQPFNISKYYNKKDPSKVLTSLSKPATRFINSMFIGKLNSLDKLINAISTKKNGFKVLIDSDTSTIIKKINTYLSSVVESYINDIILTLIEE